MSLIHDQKWILYYPFLQSVNRIWFLIVPFCTTWVVSDIELFHVYLNCWYLNSPSTIFLEVFLTFFLTFIFFERIPNLKKSCNNHIKNPYAVYQLVNILLHLLCFIILCVCVYIVFLNDFEVGCVCHVYSIKTSIFSHCTPLQWSNSGNSVSLQYDYLIYSSHWLPQL